MNQDTIKRANEEIEVMKASVESLGYLRIEEDKSNQLIGIISELLTDHDKLRAQLKAAEEKRTELELEIASCHRCLDDEGIPINLGGNKYSLEGRINTLNERVETLESLIYEAGDFVDSHSEPWYTSGQELLAKLKQALTT